MPADDRTLAIAAALGLPVYRLSALRFARRGDGTMVVMPTYAFRDADAERLLEVLARYAGPVDPSAAPAADEVR